MGAKKIIFDGRRQMEIEFARSRGDFEVILGPSGALLGLSWGKFGAIVGQIWADTFGGASPDASPDFTGSPEQVLLMPVNSPGHS